MCEHNENRRDDDQESDTRLKKSSKSLAEKRRLISDKKKSKNRTDAMAAAVPSQEQLNKLLSHYQGKQYAQAEAIAVALSQQYPEHPFAWKVLGAIFHNQGKCQQALEPTRRSVELSPLDSDAHLNLGAVLRDLGQLEDAENSCREAIRLKPNNALAQFNLGITLCDLGKLTEARECYDRTLELDPNQVSALLNLSALCLDLNLFYEAEAKARALLTIDSQNSRALHNLGSALMGLERVDEALEIFTEAIRLAPADLALRRNQGKALQKLGRLTEAEACHRTVITAESGNAEAHLLLANTLQDLGRFSEAEQSYFDAARLKPDMPELAESLLQFSSLSPGHLAIPHPVSECDRAVREVSFAVPPHAEISDEAVHSLLYKFRTTLSQFPISTNEDLSQAFRRDSVNLDCERHFEIFNEYGVVPKYCFGCFKIQIQTSSVLDLIKLYLIFDRVDPSGGKTRKCMIEMRPEFSGLYKGFVYCSEFDEARTLARSVNSVVVGAIGDRDGTSVTVKHGCSEYGLVFPDYKTLPENDQPCMDYPSQWAQIEAEYDGRRPNRLLAKRGPTKNGFTLSDVLTINNWISFAKGVGDPKASDIEQDQLFSPLFFERGKHRREIFES